MKIKKGDKVKIITGKDKGKTGVVKLILKEKNKILVQGINFVSKFKKKKNEQEKGGISRIEAPIAVSNAMVIDPEKNKPSRIGYKIVENKKIRFTKKFNSDLK